MLERFSVPITPAPEEPAVPEGPFPTPTPLGQSLANLAFDEGSLGFLIEGQTVELSHSPADDLLVSWQIVNNSPFRIEQTFTIELRMDDLVLAQWVVEGLNTRTFLFASQVAGLFSGFEIPAGTYRLSIVIDPRGDVHENIEHDNSRETFVTIVGDPDTPDLAPEFLPNLLPSPVFGKSESIFASSHVGDPLSGKLSVDEAAFVAFGITNDSIQFVDRRVEVDLYFDDKLARRVTWSDIGAKQRLPFGVDDLRDMVEITPGPHTLRLVVDPLNRIRESDETDNEHFIELVWGSGEPPPAAEPFVLEPPEREPLTRANLKPFRPFGWDSGITASLGDDMLEPGQDGWLEASKATRIDFAFTNASRFSLPLTNQLAADVLINGQFIERRTFNSGASNVGETWEGEISLPADAVVPGQHLVRIVLDPEGLFEELNESDNIFEREFTWHDSPQPVGNEAFSMTDAEIEAAFAPIFGGMRQETRSARVPDSGARDWTPEVIEAGRAAYYLLTGRDVDEEGYVLNFLDPDVYDAESTATCMSFWITLTLSEYRDTFDFCTIERGDIGFKTRANGQIHLFMDMGLSPLDALGTYLHELGHALQDLRNPHQTDLPWDLNLRGMFEAQAQIFEAAGWRAIEEHMGQQLGLYPDVTPARDQFEFIFELRRDRGTEHDLGYRLLWVEALSDSGDLGLDEILRTEGKLDSSSAMALFDKLVNMPAGNVEAWVAEHLKRTDLMDEFEQIASQRFVADLPPEETGHPALQDATWTAP